MPKPAPSPPAARLRRRIAAAGPIPFAEFMEEALYGDGGYYAREELPIGVEGDYVTGSSHSPLFGRATARWLAALDRALGRRADFFEAGFGNGTHLAALVAALAAGGGLAGRRLLAWDRVPRPVPAGVERVEGPAALAARPVRGLVFSFELFDALPVHRLVGRQGGARELWVGLDGAGRFEWREAELSDPALAALPGAPLEEGQVADLSPAWRPLYRSLAAVLERGLLVTCDYGGEAERLLDPRVRRHGTLGCFRGQRAHRDPFADPGREDLTAHVDFSALIAEGEAAGLETLVLTRQAAWLAASGLLEDLAAASPAERIEGGQLMDLEGMGGEIRVLVQGRGVEREPLFDPRFFGREARSGRS